MSEQYDHVRAAGDFLMEHVGKLPPVAVVLGSGSGGLIERVLGPRREIAYEQIPHWPVGKVAGHAGRCVLGRWVSVGGASAEKAGTPVMVLSGRAHLYEGFSPNEVAFGVRVLGLLGVKTVVLTNAAGGINQSWRPPCLALVSDHINLQGANPLAGPNEERFGTRFPAMTGAYDAAHRDVARAAAASLGIRLEEGVYAGVFGPSFETPAEIAFLRAIGADMAGMSTVAETIAARHLGMQVLGISLVTNAAAGMNDGALSHEEVLEAGEALAGDLGKLLDQIVPLL